MSYRTEVVDPGDEISKHAHQANVESYGNCSAVEVVPVQPGNFRGPVLFGWKRPVLELMLDGKVKMMVQTDGAGHKPQIIATLNTAEHFRTLATTIGAMTLDDFGKGFPVVLANQLDTGAVTPENLPLALALFEGYGDMLARTGVVGLGGETAVERFAITTFWDHVPANRLALSWCGNCIGLVCPELMSPERTEVTPGMAIVGFVDSGFGCNGATLLIKVIMRQFGNDPDKIMAAGGHIVGFLEGLARPCPIYAPTMAKLNGWQSDGTLVNPLADVRQVIHVTGGGIWKRVKEALPPGVGATLSDLPQPAPALLRAQDWAVGTPEAFSDLDAYGTFHGGCRMLVICPPNQVETIVRVAQRNDITAMKVGETVVSPESEILITSRFNGGGVLSSLQLGK